MAHFLVPKHVLVKPDKEKAILDKFGITKAQLPRILVYDPPIQDFEAKSGDIIEITETVNGKKNVHYRVVVE